MDLEDFEQSATSKFYWEFEMK